MKTIWSRWTKEWITSLAAVIFLMIGIWLRYLELITWDTLVAFSIFPLGLLFSKDKWFSFTNTNKSKRKWHK